MPNNNSKHINKKIMRGIPLHYTLVSKNSEGKIIERQRIKWVYFHEIPLKL